MNTQQIVFLLVSLVGGGLVMLSYYKGLRTKSGVDALWGGTPTKIRKAYTASMLVSALGYMVTFIYILNNLTDANQAVAGPFTNYSFVIFFALIQFPSAVWVPLVVKMTKKPSEGLWFAIRAGLALVGIGALLVVVNLLSIDPRPQGFIYTVSLISMVWFTIHTAVLDALFWPSFWKRKPI